MAKIYICGFMAAGKTYTGERLSKELGFTFYDLDSVIKEKENKRIVDIFMTQGEEHFRTLETKYLKDIVTQDDIVVSLGGGTVLSNTNVKLIKDNDGKIIFLDTDIESILERVKNEEKRPLLKSEGPEKAKELYYSRLPIYKEISDFTTHSSDLKEIRNIIGI